MMTVDRAVTADLLELHNVTKRFGAVTALNQISLQVPAGSFLTLLGPSGCGKTTTLNLIAGFEYPDEGTILLQGRAINALPPYKRPFNTVFQSYALFPHLNVERNVGFGLRMQRRPKDEIRERVGEALAMMRMSDFARREVDQLSGGQRQRVALARALVNRPKIVLLDEPLSALDANLRRSMQYELKQIQDQVGITFIYVTHDQEEALIMSDRICVLHAGQIEQIGTPEELYERPHTRFVAGFLGRNNFLSGRLYAEEHCSVLRLQEDVVLKLPPHPAVKGEIVTVAVRPERLKLASVEEDTGGRENVIAGIVRQVSFLGDRLEARVEIASGEEVLLYVNGMEIAALDRVRVHFPPEFCRLLGGEE